MNTIKISRFGAWVGAVLLTAPVAMANITNGVNPNYVKVKVYEVQASQNDNCSNPVRIFSNANPAYVDAAHSPTFGAGSLPQGTYRCFMLKMDDHIISQPSVDQGQHGACVGNQTVVTQDIAAPHGSPGIYSQAPDGSHIPITDGEEIVWLYWRTGGSIGGPNQDPDMSFVPTKGMLLAAPVTVSGDRDLTFVFNFDGKEGEDTNDGTHYYCSADAPVMSVR